MSPAPFRQAILLATVLAALAVAGLSRAEAAGTVAKPLAGNAKRSCVYSAHRISTLRRFSRLVRREMDCALVYSASPDWAGWERPWFLQHPDPDLNWRRWATARRGRHLVITQNLFPASERRRPWRRRGAAGRYTAHARRLARNLVAAGLGHATIRLSHEANGVWNADHIGRTRRDFRLWRRFWRRTALAMRSVPGARFRFDWCVLAAVRPIPPRLFYPGDDVVDFVGVDLYDSGVRGRDRWRTIARRPLGAAEMLRFARRHRKPLTIPEWGVGPRGDRKLLSGGDNPGYVRGIARLVRRHRVAYQSYFFNHEWARQLPRSPRSLGVYRRFLRGR